MLHLLGNGFAAAPPVRLDGPACYAQPAQARDWRAWAELRERSRAFLVPWEPSWPPDALTRAAFARRLRRQAYEWRQDMGYSFLVFDRESDELVGGLGLANVRRGVAQMATLGYWVGEPYARRGYISAATRLILRFSFGQLGLHRIEASCLPANVASQGLLEKVGFVREGHARAYLRIKGEWRDHVLYGLTREDWAG
jgi:[ribosomal protein S5]-alanine N-acetyltransferase